MCAKKETGSSSFTHTRAHTNWQTNWHKQVCANLSRWKSGSNAHEIRSDCRAASYRSTVRSRSGGSRKYDVVVLVVSNRVCADASSERHSSNWQQLVECVSSSCGVVVVIGVAVVGVVVVVVVAREPGAPACIRNLHPTQHNTTQRVCMKQQRLRRALALSSHIALRRASRARCVYCESVSRSQSAHESSSLSLSLSFILTRCFSFAKLRFVVLAHAAHAAYLSALALKSEVLSEVLGVAASQQESKRASARAIADHCLISLQQQQHTRKNSKCPISRAEGPLLLWASTLTADCACQSLFIIDCFRLLVCFVGCLATPSEATQHAKASNDNKRAPGKAARARRIANSPCIARRKRPQA